MSPSGLISPPPHYGVQQCRDEAVSDPNGLVVMKEGSLLWFVFNVTQKCNLDLSIAEGGE